MHHFHCYSFVANEIVNLNRARFERIEEEEEEEEKSRKTVEFVAVVIDFRHDSIIYFFYPSFLFFFALFRIVTDRKIIAYRLSGRSGQREGGEVIRLSSKSCRFTEFIDRFRLSELSDFLPSFPIFFISSPIVTNWTGKC